MTPLYTQMHAFARKACIPFALTIAFGRPLVHFFAKLTYAAGVAAGAAAGVAAGVVAGAGLVTGALVAAGFSVGSGVA